MSELDPSASNHLRSRTGARILIVDDRRESILLLTRILLRAGYERIDAVTDARRVVEHVEEFSPDLVVLDLHMPYRDGFQIMTDLEPRMASGLRVLVMTGEVTEEARDEAIRRGASDVLRKPYDVTEAAAAVDRILREQRGRP